MSRKAVHLLLTILCVAIAACGRAPAPVAETAPAHEHFDLPSAHLAETRRINVYLPPDYGAAASTRYPVLYMPDGGLAEDFPHLATTVDAAIRAGRMRPLIVAGIENTERRRDMTGPTTVESDRRVAPRIGGSAAFRAFIAEELIAQVESRYRASGERGIVGESLAGWFVVETFLVQPGLFDVSIALSPSLWWNGAALVDGAAGPLAAWPEKPATLYLAWADETDIGPPAERLAQMLRRHAPPQLRWQAVPRPDLRHATIYRALAPEVLPALYPPLPAAAADGASSRGARTVGR
ncbi:MAG TPA: alpha/beta hydrolase-fold protein [Dokdonella sp.]|uniref:alpha/beta hydrolase n=1 Tax=Dokdonella sp. TaxID=2291710 RepID=UPI002CB71F02|nr:alpha/beta hydrolase-fold protein [Dokdonella sp.]HUD42358.1 alpha/beta hydrolase-fold protein [Dokdonella sp.]